MNIKRILLIGLILVAVAASLSIVSADSSVKIAGMDFNIPDGYIEKETVAMDGVSGSFTTLKGEEIQATRSMKGFEKGNDIIGINVYEFDSPDDAKKIQDDNLVHYVGTQKTINGHEGIYFEADENGDFEFEYCKDNYLVVVVISDESLFEKVVPK